MKRRTSTDKEAVGGSKPPFHESSQEGFSRLGQHVVELEFVGSLQRMAPKRQVAFPLEVETTLSELLTTLEQTYGVELSGAFSTQSAMTRRFPCLVLINDREVSVLDGAQTRVKPGDKVVFIPVAHGG